MKRRRDKARAGSMGNGFRLRILTVLGMFALVQIVLLARAVDLQIVRRDFHDEQGKVRHLRVVKVAAHRGIITDRHGEPLAVSTPVDTVAAVPGELVKAQEELPRLAAELKSEPQALARQVSRYTDREFMYLKRHLEPEKAARVAALGVPGVYLMREYRRYYPQSEVAGHLVGFTNIDGTGIAGLEWAYDDWLSEQPGRKRVIKDRLGNIVEDVELLEPARPGQALATSLDLRIQYLAYRELKAAVSRHAARSASAVVLDVRTGEVLAMVNQPSFNPNSAGRFAAAARRNRACTDILEPGSSFKPFVLAAALESGRFGPDSVIDTSPGFLRVANKTIRDKHDLGRIDLTTVLTKSSNVGASKVALSLDPGAVWELLTRFGFGAPTASGFPGESGGLLAEFHGWREIGLATLSYGYGLSVTPLQLAQGYAAIGAYGVRYPVSLLRLDEPPRGSRVLTKDTARALIAMMETVVTDEGTGIRARVPGYRVAGKTGTAWKFANGGYSTDRYLAVFAGLAPASNPRIAAAVVIDEPAGEEYYGGEVAAPVFAEIVAGALRYLAVSPDDLGPPDDDRILQAMEAHR